MEKVVGVIEHNILAFVMLIGAIIAIILTVPWPLNLTISLILVILFIVGDQVQHLREKSKGLTKKVSRFQGLLKKFSSFQQSGLTYSFFTVRANISKEPDDLKRWNSENEKTLRILDSWLNKLTHRCSYINEVKGLEESIDEFYKIYENFSEIIDGFYATASKSVTKKTEDNYNYFVSKYNEFIRKFKDYLDELRDLGFNVKSSEQIEFAKELHLSRWG